MVRINEHGNGIVAGFAQDLVTFIGRDIAFPLAVWDSKEIGIMDATPGTQEWIPDERKAALRWSGAKVTVLTTDELFAMAADFLITQEDVVFPFENATIWACRMIGHGTPPLRSS